MIRNSCKALIIKEDKLLLNFYDDGNGGFCCGLPGGGQHNGESLQQAVKRECLEETGYSVTVGELAALYEHIIRRKKKVHKLYFVFSCTVNDDNPPKPLAMDTEQTGCDWVPVEDFASIPFAPAPLKQKVIKILDGEEFSFLD